MSKNMVLQRVVLQNFKRHADLEVAFAPTLTVVRGPNYAGKSSVLAAVFFALFGATAVAGGRNVVVRRGATSCSVELHVTLDGRPCQITRTPTTARVELDGEVLATGHTSVNGWVETTLGMPQKLVVMLANSSQGEASALLTLGATALNRVIEEVSGSRFIDELIDKAKALSEVSSKAASQKAEPSALEEVEAELKRLEEELPPLQGQLEFLEGQYAQAAEARNKAKQVLSDAVKQNSEIAQGKNRLEAAKASLGEVKKRVSEEQEALAEVTYVDPAPLKQKGEDLAEKEGFLQEVASNLRSLETAKATSLDLLSKEAGWKAAEEECLALPAMKTDLDLLTAACTGLHSDYKVCSSNAQRLTQAAKDSVCPTCKRSYEEHNLEEIQKELEAAVEAESRAKKEYEDAVVRWKQASEAFKRLQDKAPPADWKEKLEACKAGLETLEVHIVEAKKAKDGLSEVQLELSELRQEAREIHKNNSLHEARKASLDRSLGLLANKEQTVKELQIYESLEVKSLDSLFSEEAALTASAEQLLGELSTLKQRNTSLLGAIGTLAPKRKALEEEVKSRALQEKRSKRFSDLQVWLRNNKATFMRETWDSLLMVASEFVSQVTGGVVESVTRSDEGEFFFVERGESLPVDGCASGGQKSIMGVALRVALASLLPQGCQFVVLDEPSADLNDEHAAALSGALRGLERQVVMVTHREGDEFASDAVVTL